MGDLILFLLEVLGVVILFGLILVVCIFIFALCSALVQACQYDKKDGDS